MKRKTSNPAKFDRCVKAVTKRGGAANAYAVCKKSVGNEGKRKKNPGQAAAEAYEDFHGKPSEETITVQEQIHFHRHLAAAGELERLVIQPVDRKLPDVTLRDFDGAILAFNEKRNQLFVKGGDQSVDLAMFGITELHEVETLGPVKVIDYFTTKEHLGKDGGTAIYVHRFRTEERGGRTVIVKVMRWPDAIYYVRDKRIVFSGGSYTILPEGIDN
jgi:hypothetical protein